MKGPARLLRQDRPEGLKDLGPLHEWEDKDASLVLDRVEHGGRRGAVMCYTNPPVHQIGNPGLDAMLAALGALEDQGDAEFLILTWPCDPVHAGGDLKESQRKLADTERRRRQLEDASAITDEIEALYAWADGRLDKGQALYRAVRKLSGRMRTVGVCGGGLRFGGSAEVNLMADLLVGDSRGGMCFSEAMIGLIPGWSGVARALTKAGRTNARWMAATAAQVGAADLERIGIYSSVIEIDEPLPQMKRTRDREVDKVVYAEELAAHDERVWPVLLAEGLRLATMAEAEVPRRPPPDRAELATAEQIDDEVARRSSPETYRALWGRPLKEVREEIGTLGRPLAPQSVDEVNKLILPLASEDFDEDLFVENEKHADARLYRDRRLAEGIAATLEQRVADFRLPK